MVLLGNQSLNFSYSMWLAQPITECDWLNQSLNFSYSMWLAEPITEFLLFHVTCSASHRFCFHWQIQTCDWFLLCFKDISMFSNLLEVDHELESVRLIHIFEFLHPSWLNSTPWQVVIIISFASLRTKSLQYIYTMRCAWFWFFSRCNVLYYIWSASLHVWQPKCKNKLWEHNMFKNLWTLWSVSCLYYMEDLD